MAKQTQENAEKMITVCCGDTTEEITRKEYKERFPGQPAQLKNVIEVQESTVLSVTTKTKCVVFKNIHGVWGFPVVFS